MTGDDDADRDYLAEAQAYHEWKRAAREEKVVRFPTRRKKAAKPARVDLTPFSESNLALRRPPR